MKKWLTLLALVLLIWLSGVFAWIWIGPAEQEGATADYAIVLGAAVDVDQPSPVFQARIDHAVDLWRQSRVEQLIFTGGLGEGDDLTESRAAMYHAIAKGVAVEAIVLEGRSRTTMENLVFSQPGMLDIEDGTVLIVSDPLHLRRAMIMAGDLGYAAQPSATPLTRYQGFTGKVRFALRELYFIHHYWLLGE